jgi:hypothetical protein
MMNEPDLVLCITLAWSLLVYVAPKINPHVKAIDSAITAICELFI